MGGLEPEAIGWRSILDPFADILATGADLAPDARRFEEGMPPFPSLYALAAGLEFLAQYDAGAVAAHVRALGGRLRDELAARGLVPLGPGAAAKRAGIVAIADGRAEEHAALLRERGVVVWGRAGHARVGAPLQRLIRHRAPARGAAPDLAPEEICVKTTAIRTRIVSVPYHEPDRWSGGQNAGLTTVLSSSTPTKA